MTLNEDNGIKIADISKVNLEPGDVILLKYGQGTSPQAIRDSIAGLKKLFPDIKVIAMNTANMDLEILKGGKIDNE